jgi:hypothetical protein
MPVTMPRLARKPYAALATDEQPTENNSASLHSESRNCGRSQSIWNVVLLLCLVLISLTIGYVMHAYTTDVETVKVTKNMSTTLEEYIDTCGNSTTKAKEIGCIYDVMLQSWVPPDCYYKELSEFYLSTYRWKWYYDLYAEFEMPDEVMRLGEHEAAYMIDGFHRHHCMYTWEITTFALKQKKPLLDAFLSPEHVNHCNKVMFGPVRERNETNRILGVKAERGFSQCAPYDTWHLDL